ncbi:MAG TPA: polyprenyl synthetase family protein [Ktedonobacteraceae bacterium]|nr:polyprenyl synthetase family protein [Ktedonobacteraceae bacterium]
MTLTPGIQATLFRYSREILEAMRHALARSSMNSLPTQAADLHTFYGQMQYHLGWVDSNFSPMSSNPGKLLRPTLLLLAYEAAGAWGLTGNARDEIPTEHLHRALPAAAALELTHNFTLIHDDIVDGDTERRHRPTLWAVWGSPQGINTGDGMFALGRLALWDCLDVGVEGAIAARLGAVLDRACLVIAEGQYLDLSFEKRQDISVEMYVDMISRKTAVLMSCAAEMGAMLGTRDTSTIESLRTFGFEMGIAFQVRDDVLGVWATSAELGKTSAGDIYRRKKSLPVLHALAHASVEDRQTLQQLYEQEAPLSEAHVADILGVFARTYTRDYCLSFLSEQCARARRAFNNIPRLANPVAARALEDMETLVHFVEATIRA